MFSTLQVDKSKIFAMNLMNTSYFRLITFTSFLLIVSSCSRTQSIVSVKEAVSSEKFLSSPFGHDESIKAFTRTLPKKTKIRKLVKRNAHYPEKTDTIYQFAYKSSEVLIYKTHFNREILIAGTVADSKVEMMNGLKVGITRNQLYHFIKDIKKTEADTLKISTPDNTRNINFIFKKDKLTKVMFTSYFD